MTNPAFFTTIETENGTILETKLQNLIARMLKLESKLCELDRLTLTHLVKDLEEVVGSVNVMKVQMGILMEDYAYRKSVAEDLK